MVVCTFSVCKVIVMWVSFVKKGSIVFVLLLEFDVPSARYFLARDFNCELSAYDYRFLIIVLCCQQFVKLIFIQRNWKFLQRCVRAETASVKWNVVANWEQYLRICRFRFLVRRQQSGAEWTEGLCKTLDDAGYDLRYCDYLILLHWPVQ